MSGVCVPLLCLFAPALLALVVYLMLRPHWWLVRYVCSLIARCRSPFALARRLLSRPLLSSVSRHYIADRPISGPTIGATPLSHPSACRILFGRLGRLSLCVLLSLSLTVNLLLSPLMTRPAYALDPVTGVSLTGEFLSHAFGLVGGALTGLAPGPLIVTAGAAGIGSYAWWASENPEDAALFEQNLRDNLVAQNVDGTTASGIRVDLANMPASLKSSIVSNFSGYAAGVESSPVVPDDLYLTPISAVPSSFAGATVHFNPSGVLGYGGGCYYVVYNRNRIWNGSYEWAPYLVYVLESSYFFNGRTISVPDDGTMIYYEITYNSGTPNVVTRSSSVASLNRSSNVLACLVGYDLGLGMQQYQTASGVPAAVSSSFSGLVAGTGTAADVVASSNIGAVNLPAVTVDTASGVPAINNAYDYTNVTYNDIVIQGSTPAPDIPVYDFTDVLSGLNSIAGLLTPLGQLNLLSTVVQSLDGIRGVIIDIPPAITSIRDIITDIPADVKTIADSVIDLPQDIADIRDGVITLPQDIAAELSGVITGIPSATWGLFEPTITGLHTGISGLDSGLGTLNGTASSVLAGVDALPGQIADALGLDWLLDNTDQLRRRLPEEVPVFVLPSATWAEFVAAATDFKDLTPVGPIWDFGGAVLDAVKGDGNPSPPRYEFTFPNPIHYTFVVDFSDLGPELPVVSRAFCYIVFAFFYVRFARKVVEWYRSMLGKLELEEVSD